MLSFISLLVWKFYCNETHICWSMSLRFWPTSEEFSCYFLGRDDALCNTGRRRQGLIWGTPSRHLTMPRNVAHISRAGGEGVGDSSNVLQKGLHFPSRGNFSSAFLTGVLYKLSSVQGPHIRFIRVDRYRINRNLYAPCMNQHFRLHMSQTFTYYSSGIAFLFIDGQFNQIKL